jgi:alcohol dehydrogenase (cytochrome c)
MYIASIEGCNYLETIEQKDFVDQGGAVKPRERFHGGADQVRERLYGGLEAVDPTNGELKADLTLIYPNYSGALATAGNLVFLGSYDGTFAAYDAKTLKELWSFNIGTGINAPPISFAVNGKQYIAVLAGSKQSLNIIPFSPELKNTSTASMLFVFSL